MSDDMGPTYRELEQVACPTCGAKAGDECTFTKSRRSGARVGESMGHSVHQRRYVALEQKKNTTEENR